MAAISRTAANTAAAEAMERAPARHGQKAVAALAQGQAFRNLCHFSFPFVVNLEEARRPPLDQ
jgi:hypothetical protein